MNFFREKKRHLFLYSLLAIISIAVLIFVNHNASFYKQSIAKVTEVEILDQADVTDFRGNADQQFVQYVIAILQNGEEKGQEVELTNEYTYSGAYDYEYKIGQELLVALDSSKGEGERLTGEVKEIKRDKYLAMVVIIFAVTLIIVGRKQGFYSVISLGVNAALLSFALDVYIRYSNISLVIICGVTAILFTAISLMLTNGRNEKTYAAIVATLIGTIVSLFVTYMVIWGTDGKGLHYEEMQFLSRPYEMIFMASLFVGSLGAVMDIAITMSASIFEIYEKNRDISLSALQKSGMAIGKDVMGTMTSILFFVYVSGSLPMLLVYLKNAAPLGFTLSINLSLELARALAGGIGIVLTIPIGLYTAIFFISRKKASS